MLTQDFSTLNQRYMPHFLETVRLLHERLADNDDEAKISCTTTAAIMGLTGHALLSGNTESARHHMEGLSRIVRLRGGADSFKENPKLLIEILRCDIGIALYSGSKTLIFDKSWSQESYPPLPNLKPLLELRKPVGTCSQYPLASVVEYNADELTRAWRAMSEFCSIVNFAADSGQFISVQTLLETLSSVMYRLLGMRFDDGSNEEAIRLGLLAYSSSVFLQWQNLGMSFPYLISDFRSCLTTINFQSMCPNLSLWLFMIGATFVFDATDDWWLRPDLLLRMVSCGTTSWSQMKQSLESVMWIGLIHDKPGKRVFDSTSRCLNSTTLRVSPRSPVLTDISTSP